LFPGFGAKLGLDNCTPTIILNNPAYLVGIARITLFRFANMSQLQEKITTIIFRYQKNHYVMSVLSEVYFARNNLIAECAVQRELRAFLNK
jgi:hypothetical protein